LQVSQGLFEDLLVEFALDVGAEHQADVAGQNGCFVGCQITFHQYSLFFMAGSGHVFSR
jgi:hypothetical protein